MLLELLALNTPEYFAPEEAADFDHYLDAETEDYFVALSPEGEIVGCGGINYFPQEQLARISWDMVHPQWQGKGVGGRLLQYRMELLRQTEGIHTIMVRTTQLVFPFYAKNGFALTETIKDYWAPGFDLYSMLYHIE